MKVKICGITNINDANNAINANADAIGFVLYEPSPRYIKASEIKSIIEKMPPFVEKVGLFVGKNSEYINNVSTLVGFTLVQIIDCLDKDKLNIPYIQVQRIGKKEDLLSLNLDKYNMIDSHVDAYGGVGVSIALEYFDNMDCSKLILAGGIDINNVDKIRKYGFYGIDVSSSVEIKKGIKDKNKMENLIKQAKIYE